jgi:glyoxylase-like metal-dependent hydrolase (beta-lactamase superfamily II)
MKIQYQSTHLIVFESALFRTTSTLVIGSDYILLVDPNWLPIELDFIEKTIEPLAKNKEKYLLFTHSDYDHIIGYGQFKQYQTIASENFVQHPSKEMVLQEIKEFDDAYYIQRTYPITYPKIDHVITKARQQLRLGSEWYTFFQARGHNRDGLMAYCQQQKLLVVGDYLCNVEFPYIYDSVNRYLDTLATLEMLLEEEDIALLVAGHGDATSDKSDMQGRITTARQYIDQLIASVTSDKIFKEKEWLERYNFPIIMKQFHLKNIALAAKEFNP